MIFTFIMRWRIRKPRHAHLSLPTYFSKGYIMSKTLTLPNDAQATIKVTAQDAIGAPIAVPAGGSAASSDTTLFNASVDASGAVLVVAVPGAVGTGTLTYTNGNLTEDKAEVVVAAPAASIVQMDVADAVLSAQVPTSASAPSALAGSTVLPTA